MLYRHGKTGHLKLQTPATTHFICWLKLFAKSYGQYSPENNTTILSYWLNKQYLFNLYLDEVEAPHLSKSAFYQNFKHYFSFNRDDKSLPHVVISKYSSHREAFQIEELCTSRSVPKWKSTNISRIMVYLPMFIQHLINLVFYGPVLMR